MATSIINPSIRANNPVLLRIKEYPANTNLEDATDLLVASSDLDQYRFIVLVYGPTDGYSQKHMILNSQIVRITGCGCTLTSGVISGSAYSSEYFININAAYISSAIYAKRVKTGSNQSAKIRVYGLN